VPAQRKHTRRQGVSVGWWFGGTGSRGRGLERGARATKSARSHTRRDPSFHPCVRVSLVVSHPHPAPPHPPGERVARASQRVHFQASFVNVAVVLGHVLSALPARVRAGRSSPGAVDVLVGPLQVLLKLRGRHHFLTYLRFGL
jgi:hypothetical protein